MFDPGSLERLVGELEKLNVHLDRTKPEALRQSIDRLSGELRTFNGNMKKIHQLSKQLYILNTIMLKVGKTAGGVGVVQTLLRSFVKMAEDAV